MVSIIRMVKVRILKAHGAKVGMTGVRLPLSTTSGHESKLKKGFTWQ